MSLRAFALFLATILSIASIATPAWGQEQEQKQQEKTLAEKLIENPDDTDTFNQYMRKNLSEIMGAANSNPEKAEALLKSMAETVDALESEKKSTQTLIRRAKNTVEAMKSRIELAQLTLDEIVKRISDDPSDLKSVRQYSQKVGTEIMNLTREDLTEAEAELEDAREFLETSAEKAGDEDKKVVAAYSSAIRSLGSLTRRIASAKKLKELIGKEAAELNIDTWVNGEAISTEDTKGKVVLLDFWAVWCGPCINTFPHLREWNEEYADKGLVMVGVTSYYNYEWDDEKERAMRSNEPVDSEDENAMLEKFAKHHKLSHRFAIQGKGRELSKYYGVSGIPQVVVIDREGIIRMIKVGSGEENAKEIGDLLNKLINESKTE